MFKQEENLLNCNRPSAFSFWNRRCPAKSNDFNSTSRTNLLTTGLRCWVYSPEVIGGNPLLRFEWQMVETTKVKYKKIQPVVIWYDTKSIVEVRVRVGGIFPWGTSLNPIQNCLGLLGFFLSDFRNCLTRSTPTIFIFRSVINVAIPRDDDLIHFVKKKKWSVNFVN